MTEVVAFTDDDGKKQCGLCAHKAEHRVWVCTRAIPQPASEKYAGWVNYPCPAPSDCPGFERKPEVVRNLQVKRKGLPVPKGMKFLYLGLPGSGVIFIGPKSQKQAGSQDHEGVVTVAWISPAPGILHLGFSFCNPGHPGVPPRSDFKGRPAVRPDSFCKAEGRDYAMKNLYDDPLAYSFLYNAKRAVCDVVKATLNHDPRLKQFASVPPLLKVPSWTKNLGKRPKICVLLRGDK
jgi:hypothetical protein